MLDFTGRTAVFVGGSGALGKDQPGFIAKSTKLGMPGTVSVHL